MPPAINAGFQKSRLSVMQRWAGQGAPPYRTNWDLGVDINLCDLYYQGDWKEQDTWNLINHTSNPIKSTHRPIYEESYFRLSWFLASWNRYWLESIEFWEHQNIFPFYGFWIRRLKILYPSHQKDYLLKK